MKIIILSLLTSSLSWSQTPTSASQLEGKESKVVAMSIISEIRRQTGGDQEKMRAILEEIQRNPSALERYVNSGSKTLMNKVVKDLEVKQDKKK